MNSSILKNFGSAFSFTLYNIRTRFFHTFLSVLGIVIGVASLVVVLSLIDGMESSVREEIAKTTSINFVIINSDPYKTVDGIKMRKEEAVVMTYDLFDSLRNRISGPASGQIVADYGAEVRLGSAKKIGTQVQCSSEQILRPDPFVFGHEINRSNVLRRDSVVAINRVLANGLEPDSTAIGNLIGKKLAIKDQNYSIVGIYRNDSKGAEAVIPITLMEEERYRERPPVAFFEASSPEEVTKLEDEIRQGLRHTSAVKTDSFSVISNRARVEQITKGFLLFRVVMSFIVGISVIVGGIGVMNVLLISVAQRTMEIGVRKATGAKKRDIVVQFLSESIVISSLGSLLGMIVGYLAAIAISAIVRNMAEVPFQAAFSLGTLFTVFILAILIGIIFGTYPAKLASDLDPAEAIRYE